MEINKIYKVAEEMCKMYYKNYTFLVLFPFVYNASTA